MNLTCNIKIVKTSVLISIYSIIHSFLIQIRFIFDIIINLKEIYCIEHELPVTDMNAFPDECT